MTLSHVFYRLIKVIVSQLVPPTQLSQPLERRFGQCLSQNICQVSFRRGITNAYYIVRDRNLNLISMCLLRPAELHSFSAMRMVELLSSQINVDSRCLNPNERSNDRKYRTSKTSEHSAIYSASQLLNVTMPPPRLLLLQKCEVNLEPPRWWIRRPIAPNQQHLTGHRPPLLLLCSAALDW